LSQGRVTTVVPARDKTLPVRTLLVVLLFIYASAGCGTRELSGQSTDARPPDDAFTMSVDSPCPSGSVTFGLTAAPGAAGFYALEAQPACFSTNWLKIYDSTGAERIIIHPATTDDCGTCSTMGYPDTCATTTTSPVQIATMNWDGRYFARSTCGALAENCVAQGCAEPGQYLVAMCASDDQQGMLNRRCADVRFDYPAAYPVMGVLPPSTQQ
jgi:hypothetical protein